MRSSNFAAARLFLERADELLRGDDDLSIKAREALRLLIAACEQGSASTLARLLPDRIDHDRT
ncbi:hypothetical protein MAXJ12_27698 [Mesorhizobium alhagi CCNWXJ12-2]|jgi:hypothetical protein|uniref:Uncharacterized protein n=1 Tax=Mesorhizobium alhagi CCNWXJ12-2 TaxID=1107882 RepID=H0HZA3_9HYPH|nr:hypothetical protein MAXJ12_27698 [Mesorhizobium alhagi CCNWXJ12-2]